jgi:tetratricopeptide (TPR) repeat protein
MECPPDLKRLLDARDWRSALLYLQQVGDLSDVPPEIVGIIHAKNRRYPEAVSWLEQASRVEPLSIDGNICLADSYSETDRRELAVWLYRDLAMSEEASPDQWAEVACGLGRTGDFVSALGLCQKLCQRFPQNNAKAAFGVAYYMNRLSRPAEEILPYLKQAVAAEPHNAMFRLGLAFCLDQMGRTHEAFAHVKDVPMSEIHWPHCMPRLMQIFLSVNDQACYIACQARLRQLTEQDLPPDCEG